jgi:hypothetical protein
LSACLLVSGLPLWSASQPVFFSRFQKVFPNNQSNSPKQRISFFMETLLEKRKKNTSEGGGGGD